MFAIHLRSWISASAVLGLAIALHAGPPVRGQDSTLDTKDPTGVLRTVTLDGSSLDSSNPFFQSLGTNGRSCASCHVASAAWSITPSEVRARFDRTHGLDPIFRPVDGSNSPNADVSSVGARRRAYSMLIKKAVIRVGLPIPASAEFALVKVEDPYGFASAQELSLFRRPLPATNLRFLTTVMWDGRESVASQGTLPIVSGASSAADAAALLHDLKHQASDATTGHAQAGSPPSDSVLEAIVQFELNLTTAQQKIKHGDRLDSGNAQGGAFFLAQQPFYVTINDALGGDIYGVPFNPNSMTLFSVWAGSTYSQRASIARGATVFGTKSIAIKNVGGLNDALGLPTIKGTCTTCHDTPNVGDHSVALPIDIGLTDASQRTLDMPLYTLQNRQTGELRQTTDPGRALITGQWADIGKFKGPILRGLAARAPYFHNGSAADLEAVLDFYSERFGIDFTEQEQKDLIAFLQAL